MRTRVEPHNQDRMGRLEAFFAGFIALASAGCFEGDGAKATTLSVRWAILDEHGARASCREVGADTVRVIAVDVETSERIERRLACDRGEGFTSPIPARDYYVFLELVRCGTDASCEHPASLASSRVIGPLAGAFAGHTALGDVLIRAKRAVPPGSTPPE